MIYLCEAVFEVIQYFGSTLCTQTRPWGRRPLRIQVDHIRYGEQETTHAIDHRLSNPSVHLEFGCAPVHSG